MIRLLLPLIAFSCFFTFGCKKSTKNISDVVVAKVGPYELRSKEFATQLALRLKNFDALAAKKTENVNRIKENIFNDFLVESLTQNWAHKNNVSVTEKEVEEEVGKVRARYPNDLAFRRNLAKEHISLTRWKKSIRINLLHKKLFSTITQLKSEPSEKEMKAFYKDNPSLFSHPSQIKVRQVVTEREDKAKLFLKKLRRGTPMKELAEFSSGPEKDSGGETGWIDIDTLEVFKIAYRQPAGTRTGILKSPFGFHIIEVLKKKSGGKKSFNSSKGHIRRFIKEQKEQELYSAWLDEQIRQHNVFKNENVIAAITVATEED